MQISVDYSSVINELGSQIADLIVANSILKAQLAAVTNELNNLTNNTSDEVNLELMEEN